MVNDTYSDIISNAGGIYKYTIYLHSPHFTAPVRSPVRTPRFSSQNNPATKFYIARADSAPPTTPHAPMSLTDSAGPGVAARRRGSSIIFNLVCVLCMNLIIITSVSETIRKPPLVKAQTALKTKKIWRKTIFNMADGIITPYNVARS